MLLMKKIVITFAIIFITVVGIESVFLTKLYRENQRSNIHLSEMQEKLKIKEKEIQDINNEKEAEQTNEKKYDIDIELEKCIEKDYSTMGMNNCIYKATEKWEKEIEKNSNSLRKILKKDQIILFSEAQKSWEEYYKKEHDFIFKTIFNVQGTIHTNFASSEFYEITKQRALNIEGYKYYMEH